MKPVIVALTGLSGVGKSTFLADVSKEISFQTLQASALIKKGREHASGILVEQDRLRYANLDENQQFLVQGLEASLDLTAKLVVLDGHTLIERDADHFVVGAEVFEAAGIAAMVFLRDSPEIIVRRRRNDVSRKRPNKNATAMETVQDEALAQAELICRTVGIPLYVESPSNVGGVVQLLSSLQLSEGL